MYNDEIIIIQSLNGISFKILVYIWPVLKTQQMGNSNMSSDYIFYIFRKFNNFLCIKGFHRSTSIMHWFSREKHLKALKL